MKISRHEKGAEWLDYVDWPVLVDLPLPQTAFDEWRGERTREDGHPWVFQVEVEGVPAQGSPTYRYLIELREEDLGDILVGLPVQAVGTILDRLLREGEPEVAGELVGRIVAFLARGVAGPASRWNK